jgi:hypothetical protein
MNQILIAHKKTIVYATISNNEDWLLIHSLFSKLQEHRYSLQSINSCISSCFNSNTSTLKDVIDLLKKRITLLSILIEILSLDKVQRNVNVLDAILYHQRTTRLLLLMTNNIKKETVLSKSQLQNLLAVLGIAVTPQQTIKSDRREKLNVQQKNAFINQRSPYGAYAYQYR